MEPIGASSTWRWHGYENSWIDLDGRKVQSMTGGGHWGGGMFISGRDMARFGYLFLRNGKWNDRQIVSEKWIAMARTPGPANAGYGYMNWFLNSGPKPAFPGAPATAVTFQGNGSNIVYIDWENDLVVVVRWIQQRAFNDFIGQVLAAVAPAVAGSEDGARRPARVRSASRRHRDRAGRIRRQACGARLLGRPVRPDGRRDGKQRHRRGAARRGGSGAGGARGELARQPPPARSRHRQRRRRTCAPSPRWCGAPGRARSRSPTAPIAIPITSPPAGCSSKASSTPGCAATTPTAMPGARAGPASTSSTIRRRRRSSSTSRSTTTSSGAPWHATSRSFRPPATGAVQTRLTTPLFQQLVESRDAQFGALAGVRFAEGIVVRGPVVRETLFSEAENQGARKT